VDGVIWSAAPPALPYSLRLFRFYIKGEREGGAVFSSFYILYRISLFPFPFAVVCVFTFFSKNLCRIVFYYSYALRRHHICPPLLSFLFLKNFSSLGRASRSTHYSPQGDPRPLVVRYPYRTVSYYITILRLTDRLTNLLFVTLMVGTVQYIYLSDRKAARSTVKKAHKKHPRSSPVMYTK
jgi:hypothetical protein